MSLVSVLTFLGTLWVLWKLLRPFIIGNPLSNVPGPISHSVLSGHMGTLFDRHEGWTFKAKIGETYGPVVRLRGLLGADILYVYDPVALQHILAKDGTYYEQPSWAYAANRITFGPGLLSVRGSQHRRQRKMLISVFSPNNMRNMAPMFYHVIHKLRHAIAVSIGGSSRDIDVMHWIGRAALELVGQGGMGYSFDPLIPGRHTPHAVGEALKNLSPVSYALMMWRLLATHLERLGSPRFRRNLADLAVSLIPDHNLQRIREIINTMDAGSRAILNLRTASLVRENEDALLQVAEGKDVMSILLRENTESSAEDKLSEEEILAQITTMLFAGTDTTSNVVVHAFQLLAEQPHAQDRLRQELAEARDYPGQDFPYDRLDELPFLDAVVRETLRLYAPIDIIPRATIADAVMPLYTPIRGVDGTIMHEIVVPKGTLILPSLTHCNVTNTLWGDDALEWKPERWLVPLPKTVLDARIPGVYSNIMTFGGGSRSCIGLKFGQLEMKIILSVLLESFKFSPTSKEVVWNLSGISYPTMSRDSIEPSLILKVEAIR